ncbi:hypothetical protein B0H15DRAFT_495203 [Mycena belliarum]|uniref:Uncharacterized protein n=1 Tax=Mycena belliarum TaxID=1033014 RepID=A0AAD6TYI8_9AGAR|nr:hypothetical protein B0H15DRAFT_495203 [Mycena belliae]
MAAAANSRPGEVDLKRPSVVRFWARIILLSVSHGLTSSLSPLELTSVSTILPCVSDELQGANSIWVASVYSLASTAIVGDTAMVSGRKPCALVPIALFAHGSAQRTVWHRSSARYIPWLSTRPTFSVISATELSSYAGGPALFRMGCCLSQPASSSSRSTYHTVPEIPMASTDIHSPGAPTDGLGHGL